MEGKYKEALTKEALARAAKMSRPEGVDQLDQPFMGGYTLRQYKELPQNEREYLVYSQSVTSRGETPMSREEFNAIDDKDKHPATAMAAAIDQLYLEHKGRPPESEIKRVYDLFKEGPEPKTPTPMNWNQATMRLEDRFGPRDATGRWAVTPGLQLAHTKAQERLNLLREQGTHPLDAVTKAEEHGRDFQKYAEKSYFDHIRDAKTKEDIDIVKSDFFEEFGYLPSKKGY